MAESPSPKPSPTPGLKGDWKLVSPYLFRKYPTEGSQRFFQFCDRLMYRL